jgi:outer membrane protein, heavy metal efflux system
MKQNLILTALVAITAACSTTPTFLPMKVRSTAIQVTDPVMEDGLAGGAISKHSITALAQTVPTNLQELVLLAQEESPAVQVRFHRWQQALEQIPQAEALPDPSVSFTTYLQEVETRVGPMDGKIGVSQRFPWFGKLHAAGDQAAAFAEAKHAEVHAARLQVRSRIEVAWNQRVFLEQSAAITSAQVELLKRVEAIALSQVEVGRASQSHAIRAQIERLKMEDRLATLLNRKLIPEAQIDAAVGQSLAHTLPWQKARYSSIVSIPTESELPMALEAGSPQFQILRAQLAAAEAAEDIAELDGMPDLRFGADWTWIGEGNAAMSGSGDDAFSLTVGVEIPLQRSRVQAKRRAAVAQQAAVLADYQRQLFDLLAEATSLRFASEDAHRRVLLYQNSLTPRAEDNFATSLTSYQSGLSTFQDLLDSAQTVLEFRLATARANSERAEASARFRSFLDLPGILDSATPTSTDR